MGSAKKLKMRLCSRRLEEPLGFGGDQQRGACVGEYRQSQAGVADEREEQEDEVLVAEGCGAILALDSRCLFHVHSRLPKTVAPMNNLR